MRSCFRRRQTYPNRRSRFQIDCRIASSTVSLFVCLEREHTLVPSLLKPVEWHKKQLQEPLLRQQGTWQDRITLHFWVQPPFPRGTSKPGTDGYIANYPLEQRMTHTISSGAGDSLPCHSGITEEFSCLRQKTRGLKRYSRLL